MTHTHLGTARFDGARLQCCKCERLGDQTGRPRKPLTTHKITQVLQHKRHTSIVTLKIGVHIALRTDTPFHCDSRYFIPWVDPLLTIGGLTKHSTWRGPHTHTHTHRSTHTHSTHTHTHRSTHTHSTHTSHARSVTRPNRHTPEPSHARTVTHPNRHTPEASHARTVTKVDVSITLPTTTL